MFAALLERVATSLDRAGIPYMVIGGQAVLLYGEPRLTRDIDITLGVDVDRLKDVLSMVAACSLTVLVDPETFVRETMVLPVRDEESGIRVDLIFSFSPYERESIARVRRVTLGTTPVCFVSAEDLIVHKVVAGRPRDLEDVRGVLLRTRDLDLVAVEARLAEIDSASGESLRASFRTIRQAAGC